MKKNPTYEQAIRILYNECGFDGTETSFDFKVIDEDCLTEPCGFLFVTQLFKVSYHTLVKDLRNYCIKNALDYGSYEDYR